MNTVQKISAAIARAGLALACVGAAVLGGALCGLASWEPAWMLVLGLLPVLSGTIAESLTRPR